MAMIVVLGLSTTTKATLIDKGPDSLGNHLIYDTDLDITWYDFSFQGNSWQANDDWASGLTVIHNSISLSGWRLPTTIPAVSGNQTGSEMGHLYYTELLNPPGGPLGNTAPFLNLTNGIYWSGTLYGSDPFSDWAWYFSFNLGLQSFNNPFTTNWYGIAVRRGEVDAVPEPTTIALLGIGLVGLAGAEVRRRRKKKAVDKS